ncbi:hypothetical protein D3C74_435420 [compost metagenome]
MPLKDQIGNIRDPLLVRQVCVKLSVQVILRDDVSLFLAVVRSFPPNDCLNPQLTHKPLHTLVVHVDGIAPLQPNLHSAVSVNAFEFLITFDYFKFHGFIFALLW